VRYRQFLSIFVLSVGVSRAADAGPPFITDDPEPTDTGHWEIYNYAQGVKVGSAVTGAGGFDINYGEFENVQLTAVVPANSAVPSREPAGSTSITVDSKTFS
jgi:hypothetical protein